MNITSEKTHTYIYFHVYMYILYTIGRLITYLIIYHI